MGYIGYKGYRAYGDGKMHIPPDLNAQPEAGGLVLSNLQAVASRAYRIQDLSL